jgi:hypothetical protein
MTSGDKEETDDNDTSENLQKYKVLENKIISL